MKFFLHMRVITLAVVFFLTSCATNHAQLQPEKQQPPPEADYEYILGYNAELSGDWEGALEHYQKALKFDPGSDYLRVQMAYIYLKTGKAQEATAMAEEVVKANPNYIPALLLLGQLYNSQQRTDEAIAIYE